MHHYQAFIRNVKRIAVALCLALVARPASAQRTSAAAEPYWVLLGDKKGTTLDARRYFTPAAQRRRQRQHLPAADSTDFPVRADYVQAIRQRADTLTFVSRWFNAVACRATPAQVAALQRLPGVRAVVRRTVSNTPDAQPAVAAPAPLTGLDLQLARQQTAALGLGALHQAQLTGKGLRIAIFDVGFSGTDTHAAFAHLRNSQRVVSTWDFIRQRPFVYDYGTHGTQVLSCLAGQLPDGTGLGVAQDAEFLLARTEREYSERYSEEEAWLAAVEWADRNGADIINSSLGYTERRYFREQMNGRTSLVARAAALAVRKGMLVVCAAGNDGDDLRWGIVGTPADQDSVLSVGGIDPATWLPESFSSRGPTANRHLKPNVVAFGEAITAVPGGYERTEGTSFASPLVAGLAACLWQQQRQLSVMQLFQALQQAGSLYPYFDYAQGYGCPTAARALAPAASAPSPTFDFVRTDSTLRVVIREQPAAGPLPYEEIAAAVTSTAVDEEPLLPAQAKAPAYLYLHVADARGVLRTYEVREVTQRVVAQVQLSALLPQDVVRVAFNGYTHSYTVQP
ncbi:S8 family serine peptidase [Hymenobacter lutimineralis]|uniref:S8 family serine peptidase n=1 Tax=Hymenobacter lutimineralis TaxID=2606448 RepID=A0A5D6UX53_9BACT|nr:S8 family serine peptidase [Hymenobacter lutimineralis]TYZ08093.1 S8 family serine peptidase [Hymenobacter lutimineralis]